ncbi:MAG: MBL fold metallo-hydrolase [Candidatus Riflebacteria bacterium]|nr:MBL fold metallo-hydrolase [Candidatus Riflebacteria bacterium]
MKVNLRSVPGIFCLLLLLAAVLIPGLVRADKIVRPELYPAATDSWAPGMLDIRFFNVGKGDAMLMHLPDGRFAMIDTGYAETAPALIKKLKALGVKEISLLVITHHHKDHVGGYPFLLEAFPVNRVVQSYDPRDKEKCLVEAGTRLIKAGGVTLTVLGPTRSHKDENDASLVCHLQFGRTSVLFAADAVEESISDLLKDKKKLRADVLKVPHHGRFKGFSPRDFFAAVKAEYAIITSDEKAGDPPEGSVVRILKESGTRVLLTDELGDIQFLSDGETIHYLPGEKK